MAYATYPGDTVPPDPPLPIKDAESPPISPSKVSRKSSSASGKDLQKMKTKELMGNDSIWARIAFNPNFENTTMAVIVLNAIWIGVDTEWNHDNLVKEDGKKPLDPVATVIENLFCFYFSIELAIRFLSFRRKLDCLFNAWFVFDSILVFCMVLETWIMAIVELIIDDDSGGGVGAFSALRLLRLLRLARMGRLMRFVPEMLKLVKGMISAAKSVVWILIFLIIIIYVTSIIFTGALADQQVTPDCTEEYLATLGDGDEAEDCFEGGAFGGDNSLDATAKDLFATMGDSFMSLTTRGVLGDNLAETFDVINAESLILLWVFVIFLVITFATLLNMLIGVVCDIISGAAAEEEDAQSINILRFTIEDAFAQIDANEDNLVCTEEWAEIKNNENVRRSLQNIGIEGERMEERLEQMQEMIFADKLPEFSPEESQKLSREGNNTGSVSLATAKSERLNQGLTVQQLIEKVIQIRPDMPASALDMELLSAQVLKDHRTFKRKLKKIEEGVKKALGPAASVGDDEMPDLPALPTGDPMDHLMETEKNVSLEDVPLDLLIASLRARSGGSNLVPQNQQTMPQVMPQMQQMQQMQMQMPHAVP